MKTYTKTAAIPFEPVYDQVYQDMKSAAFVVSILINLALFIGWLALKLSS